MLPKMLGLLPIPKHHLISLSTAEKKMCKQDISAIFFGMLTMSIRAVPKIFCRVNQHLISYSAGLSCSKHGER